MVHMVANSAVHSLLLFVLQVEIDKVYEMVITNASGLYRSVLCF